MDAGPTEWLKSGAELRSDVDSSRRAEIFALPAQNQIEDDDENENDCDRALVTPLTARTREYHPRRGQHDRFAFRSRKFSRDSV
jgi:hypothetical protein